MFIPARPAPALSVPLLAGLLLGLAGAAPAEDRPAPPAAPPEPTLPAVIVTAPPPAEASSELVIPRLQIELEPPGRPADVLRLVPGIVIAQHQGGGKAEQYFLRGFDADHGTDVAIFVDGLPVNLRSHAHGQGYADLHFLIPETVQQVAVRKGPYYPELGDFDTAGAVNFVTRDVVDANREEAAGGMFGTQRYLVLLSPTRDRLKTLIALEGYVTDGPFDHPGDYGRFNAFAKATATLGEGLDLSAWASHYRGAWNGSGQIPARAVRQGLIDRFGAIDPSEGGVTQRTNLNADLRWTISDTRRVTLHAYGTYYALSLYNDFTFFLDDPVHGDEINQRDHRLLAGLDAEYRQRDKPLGVDVTTSAGLQYRADTPHVVLAHAVRRRMLERVQDVNVLEQSYSPYLKLDVAPLDRVRLVTGARGDVFTYDVSQAVNAAGGQLNGSVTRARPSVKADLVLGPWYRTELFGNFGTGFHSNDARAVILDPRQDALPTALGYEFGARTQLLPRAQLSATYWVLDLASELVFNGDSGATEAQGPTHREGWEFATRVDLLDWLTLTGGVTVTTRAEFDAGGAVPLAPRLTAQAGLTARLPGGLTAGLQMRHLGDRVADTDRQHTARGYTLFDLSARYRYRAVEAFASVENLLDAEWREAQFFFTSRLPGEPAPGVPDIHFTPGTPRSILGGLAVRF